MITPLKTKLVSSVVPFQYTQSHMHGVLNKIRIIPHIQYILSFSLNIESSLHITNFKNTIVIIASQSSYSQGKYLFKHLLIFII